MIALTLAALITVVAIATFLTLIDCALRGRSAFVVLKREQMLFEAGFVPQVEARELRLRPSARRFAFGASRSFASRLPQPSRQPAPAPFAA